LSQINPLDKKPTWTSPHQGAEGSTEILHFGGVVLLAFTFFSNKLLNNGVHRVKTVLN
jgi:hypothetical protein